MITNCAVLGTVTRSAYFSLFLSHLPYSLSTDLILYSLFFSFLLHHSWHLPLAYHDPTLKSKP